MVNTLQKFKHKFALKKWKSATPPSPDKIEYQMKQEIKKKMGKESQPYKGPTV